LHGNKAWIQRSRHVGRGRVSWTTI
jgi:hypothetical protein